MTTTIGITLIGQKEERKSASCEPAAIRNATAVARIAFATWKYVNHHPYLKLINVPLWFSTLPSPKPGYSLHRLNGCYRLSSLQDIQRTMNETEHCFGLLYR